MAGASPAINVSTKPTQLELFRRHSSKVPGKWNWVTSSGVKGLQEATVQFGKDATRKKFTVRLYFAEPDENVKPGDRLFHVELQDQEMVRNLDIAKETGGSFRTLIKEFTGVEASNELRLRLISAIGSPVLCGMEIVAEDQR